MCLRDRPTSLCPFGPVGPNTLVKISNDPSNTARAGARPWARAAATQPRPRAAQPGATESDDQTMNAMRDQTLAVQPIPRTGEPEEVARLVLFLAYQDGRFSTGSEFVVD